METLTTTCPAVETKRAVPAKKRTGPVSVAIVGAGYIATYHLEILRQMASVQVVGACDPDAARLDALCRQWDLPHGSRSLADLVHDCNPEVVHLLVPPPYHAELAEEALNAGVHVLVEKPMALNHKDCDRLIGLARANELLFAVNHNSLFHPPFRRLLEDVKAGKLGRIEHVVSTNNLGLAQLQSGEHDHWMFRSPENVLFEQGPHPLAQICELLGPVKRAETLCSHERTLRTGAKFIANWKIGLECDKGTAQLYMAFGRSFQTAVLHVIGQDGAAHVDLINDVYILDRPTRRVAPLDSAIRRLLQARQQAGCGLKGLLRYGLSTLRLTKRSDPYYLSMKGGIESFYKTLAEGHCDATSANSGRMVIQGLELATAAVRPHVSPRPAASPRQPSFSPRSGDILVMGGTGFIGRRLVADLIAAGKPVRMLVRKPALLPDAARNSDVNVCIGDACNPEDVERAIEGCQAVIHLVAGAPPNWAGFERLYVEGTRSVAEACLRHNVGQLLFASSICALYLGKAGITANEETPIDAFPEKRCDYARAKILCERLLMEMHRERNLPVTILRPGIVVGGGGPVAHLGVGTWPAPTHCVSWGRGNHGLPFVLVDDVASAFGAAIGRPGIDGKALNLVGDVRLSAAEYLQALREESGRDYRLHRRSVLGWRMLECFIWSIKAVARKPENSALSYRELAYRTASSQIDNAVTKRLLDWQPVADRERFIELGIRQAVAEAGI